MTAQAKQTANTIFGWYNVVDYGAVGNGTTDDTAAVQAAITAAQVPGSRGTVYFPAGRYYITSTLLVSEDGVALVGSGGRRYTVGVGGSAGFDYEGGAALVTDQAITVLQLGNDTVGTSMIRQGGTQVTDLGFEDTTGGQATLCSVQLMNHFTFRDCTFSRGLIGVKVNAGSGSDDASWGKLDHCDFLGNSTGVYLTSTNSSPNIEIAGGDYQVGAGQIGIHNSSGAVYQSWHDFKMDLFGAGCTGITWEGGAQLSQITAGKFEMHSDCTSTSVAIDIVSSLNGLSIVGVQIGNDTSPQVGTGIRVAGVDATTNKTTGVEILGGHIHNCALGVYFKQYAIANRVIGTYFRGSGSTFIQFDSGANYNMALAVGVPNAPGSSFSDSGTGNSWLWPMTPGLIHNSKLPSSDMYSAVADGASIGINGRMLLVSAKSLRTENVAAATPTGGSSGDIKVGTGKIWVNDGGSWKSVAIA